MSEIFISYRREDSGGHAGRLRDNLRARFGPRVFQDVDGIMDGDIYQATLEKALSTCQVAVIVIGRTWLTCTDERGHRRLDDPDDWVRIEVRRLLSRDACVIPVLVGGARMPRDVDLPEDIRSLVSRQSRELRDAGWDTDVAALVDRIRQVVEFPVDEGPALAPSLWRRHRTRALVVVAPFAVAAIVWTWQTRVHNVTSRIDVVVDDQLKIDYALLDTILREVQQDHIKLTLFDKDFLAGSPGGGLLFHDVAVKVTNEGQLRSLDTTTYTVLLTNRHLSGHDSTGVLWSNLFYLAGPRFGIVSTWGLDDLAIELNKNLTPGEAAAILSKYLKTLIPLTALQGQASALGKALLGRRSPETDHGCLTDFSKNRVLFVQKLRSGPVLCKDEYDGVAEVLGPAVAEEFKAILDLAAKTKSP
jgi:hypothetical protein